jgi:hypothetical protein
MPSITDDMRQRALAEGEKVSEGERVSRYKPNPYDVEDARTMPTARPTATTSGTRAGARVSPYDVEDARKVTPYKPTFKGTGNQRGPTAEELAAYEANRNANYGNESRRTPTGSMPSTGLDTKGMQQRASQALADDPLALAGAATGVGTAAYRAYKAGKNAYDAAKAARAVGEVPAAGREAVTNPLAWMAGPKNASKFTGEVESAGREAVTNPLAWMAGPKGMAQMNEAGPSMTTRAREAAEAAASRFRKKPLTEADTTGGAGRYGYKKGGAVKKKMASGGMTSSASKRADGIASKGKTRGKIC